jgi:hypothetical protein
MTRGLMVGVAFVLSVAAFAGAQDSAEPPETRGWIFGGGISAGTMAFPGAEDEAVAVGDVTDGIVLPYGVGLIGQRSILLVDRSAVPPAGTVFTALFPRSASGAGATLHGGFAFSPRIALLLDMEMLAPKSAGFNHAIFAAVVRYWPARRVWIEAGPATGDIGYSVDNTGTNPGSITGSGVLAAAGVAVAKKRTWTVDMQARYGQIWYNGFQARNLSLGLSVGRVRSGETSRPRG